MSDLLNVAEAALEVFKNSKVIYTEQQVKDALKSMAAKINKDYNGLCPLVLCVMNGGLFTTANLVNYLTMPINMDYIHATRYENGTEGRNLKWLAEPTTSLRGRDIVLVDDILDEGVTLSNLKKYCFERGAISVKAALLIQKNHNRCVDNNLGDYIGITVPDEYVFGCGMDYKGFFRNYPEIYVAGL